MSIGDIKPEEVHECNDQGRRPSPSTPSTSMAPQIQEQEEQNVPPQAQVTHDPPPTSIHASTTSEAWSHLQGSSN